MQAVAIPVEEPHDPRIVRGAPAHRSPNRVTRLVATTIGRPAVRQGTLSLVDQAVVSATAFATSVTVGRLCSKQDLGVFCLALTIVYLARAIQDQIVSAPYMIYCHRRHGEGQALYAGSALLHHLGLSALAVLFLAATLGLLTLGIGPAGLAPVLWVLLAALPLLLLREFIRRVAIAHLHMATAIAIDVSVAAFQIGGLLLLAYFHQLTIPAVYRVMGAACALACGGWFLSKRRPLKFAWSPAVADWRHNWRFARWVLVSYLIGSSTPYVMPWILTAVRGEAEAGVLAASISIVGLASMFIVGVAAYITPKAALAFTQGGSKELRRVLRTASLVYGCIVGAFVVCVLATGDLLLVRVFGAKYAGYGGVVGIMSISMLLLSMGLTAGNGLWAIDRPKANLTADICTLTVNLTILCCLVQPLGVYGAALADLGGNLVGVSVRWVTLHRLLKTMQCANPSLGQGQ